MECALKMTIWSSAICICKNEQVVSNTASLQLVVYFVTVIHINHFHVQKSYRSPVQLAKKNISCTLLDFFNIANISSLPVHGQWKTSINLAQYSIKYEVEIQNYYLAHLIRSRRIIQRTWTMDKVFEFMIQVWLGVKIHTHIHIEKIESQCNMDME